MSSVFVSSSRDPFFNLAFENCLFSAAQTNSDTGTVSLPLLYLWINKDVVVIGRFQNPWKECALERMENDGVLLMRRDTGGGAVFQDVRNLCFTFVGPISEHYREQNNALICNALKKLGIRAVAGGRNDITVDGLKVSGAAYREKNGVYIHHGTLLVQTDLTRLANYLNPDVKKLSSKGITSVRARVTNLAAANPGLTVQKVSDALVTTFSANDCVNPVFADESFFSKESVFAAALRTEYNRLVGWDWRYGKSPDFSHLISERFPWGGIEINLNVVGAKITEAVLFSDALETDLIPILHPIFENAVYDRSLLRRAIEETAERILSAAPQDDEPSLSSCLRDVAALF